MSRGPLAERDGVPGDRVEAEEHVLAVEDVELEQGRAGVSPDLHVSVLDEAEAGELLHGVRIAWACRKVSRCMRVR